MLVGQDLSEQNTLVLTTQEKKSSKGLESGVKVDLTFFPRSDVLCLPDTVSTLRSSCRPSRSCTNSQRSCTEVGPTGIRLYMFTKLT